MYKDPASGTTTNYCYQAGNAISYQTTSSGGCSTTPPTGSGVYNYTAGYDQLSSVTVASPSSTVSSYCYDAFGRMSVELQSASYTCTGSAPAGASLYGYDGLDRQITHRDPNATTTSSVHYDGMSATAALEDLTVSGTAKEVSYALTPGGNHSGLMYLGSSSSVQYLAADRSGSVSAVFGAAATPTCGQLYDPYGSVLGSSVVPVPGSTTCSQTTSTNTGGNTPNAFYYNDKRKDPGSGTYQLGSRTYDPSKSSFLTPDSYDNGPGNANAGLVQDPLTADRYNYVNGDPVNLVDPNGHGVCPDNTNRCLPASATGQRNSPPPTKSPLVIAAGLGAENRPGPPACDASCQRRPITAYGSPMPVPLYAATACSTDSGWSAFFKELSGLDPHNCSGPVLLGSDPNQNGDVVSYEQQCTAVHPTEDLCSFENTVNLGTLVPGAGIIPSAGGIVFGSRDEMLQWARSQFPGASTPKDFAQAFKPRTLSAEAVEYDGQWYVVRVEPSTNPTNLGGTRMYAEIYDAAGNLLADPKYDFDANGNQINVKMTRPQFEPEPEVPLGEGG